VLGQDGRYDFAVVGAGIAGASVAAELAGQARVLLLEREAQPGYHTTGRSAALFSAIYGPAQIRALSRASLPFFDAPPAGFAGTPLLTPREVMMVAREDQLPQLDAMWRAVSGRGRVETIDGAAARARMPLLRDGYAKAALLERDASDIDVHALHQGYLRALRAAGGHVELNGEVVGLARSGRGWELSTPARSFEAAVVVNAAGAWADALAVLAGVEPAGLTPKRRTALTVAAPPGAEPASWPMVVDIEENFYLKPESGRLLLSPADETPSAPCDAQPEELDIAICVDRIEGAFDLSVRAIGNKWAGLRTFAPDGDPVVGFDPAAPGFFWLAGQGGYGIQTAPAMARLAAALALGRGMPADIADQGVDEGALAPARLERAA